MVRANDDNLMNVFDTLHVAKPDINIMVLTDPGNGITTSVNDVGMMHGFTFMLTCFDPFSHADSSAGLQ